MKEQFVTYKIALVLKELGFDEVCLANAYSEREDNFHLLKVPANNTSLVKLKYGEAMPLWQQVRDWLRDVWSLEIRVNNYYNEEFWVELEEVRHPRTIDRFDLMITESFKSHNKALESGILKALELCRIKK